MSGLRARHYIEKSKIVKYLEELKNRETEEDFGYPGAHKDRLRVKLQAMFSKQTAGPTSNEPIRDTPGIHYGTIASGDTLLKDGSKRDKILAWLKKPI